MKKCHSKHSKLAFFLDKHKVFIAVLTNSLETLIFKTSLIMFESLIVERKGSFAKASLIVPTIADPFVTVFLLYFSLSGCLIHLEIVECETCKIIADFLRLESIE
jgi:hypothetical protein